VPSGREVAELLARISPAVLKILLEWLDAEWKVKTAVLSPEFALFA
jgi:hypothetical protein